MTSTTEQLCNERTCGAARTPGAHCENRGCRNYRGRCPRHRDPS